MSIDGHRFYVVDENPQAFNLSPEALGGTSVRINLIVDDADASTAQAIAAGATEVFPVADQPYGLRQGRVADPPWSSLADRYAAHRLTSAQGTFLTLGHYTIGRVTRNAAARGNLSSTALRHTGLMRIRSAAPALMLAYTVTRSPT
jgi:Uncharacterized protein conserved in bacteria